MTCGSLGLPGAARGAAAVGILIIGFPVEAIGLWGCIWYHARGSRALEGQHALLECFAEGCDGRGWHAAWFDEAYCSATSGTLLIEFAAP